MRYFHHGTTEDVGRAILENGFSSDEKVLVWNCSDPDATYFYHNEQDDNPNEGYYRALESAQLTAAFNGSTSRYVAVVTLGIPEGSPLENWVEEDNSCPNMASTAVCIEDEAIARHLKTGNAELHVEFHKVYEPGFRFLYLAGLSERYLNELPDEDDVRCLKIARRMEQDIFFDEMISDVVCSIDLPDYLMILD